LEAENSTLKNQNDRLKLDFEETVKNLHDINRYKHELELHLQAEKLTVET